MNMGSFIGTAAWILILGAIAFGGVVVPLLEHLRLQRKMDSDDPSALEVCERILALGTWEPRP